MKKMMAVLRDYFGYKPDEGLKEFSAELKALSDEDKHELAAGAARNMGLTQEQCDFDISA